MASEWIPVSERLPEVFTLYLVTLDDGTVYFLHWEWDDDFKHWVDEEGNGDYIVTAWMPLPESFKLTADVREVIEADGYQHLICPHCLSEFYAMTKPEMFCPNCGKKFFFSEKWFDF